MAETKLEKGRSGHNQKAKIQFTFFYIIEKKRLSFNLQFNWIIKINANYFLYIPIRDVREDFFDNINKSTKFIEGLAKLLPDPYILITNLKTSKWIIFIIKKKYLLLKSLL